ncbi:MAG: hypothetical protein CSB34_00065 [Desulfobulbus propionicus]|nr:MAG: hypothetical protein CSB34_00065 [Desulfobulbus propionicus]
MVRFDSPRIMQRKRRRRLVLIAGIFLLTAGGGILHWCLPSIQSLGGKLTSLVSKMKQDSAGYLPADPVLRGTIYDRNLEEMAVSYPLFSLYVNPLEIRDRLQAVQLIVEVTGEERSSIESMLKTAGRVIKISDDMDAAQAETIAQSKVAGVYCKGESVRFYPAHTVASHVLGFVDEGVGLFGVEGKYDTVLSPGAFRQADVDEVDWQDQEVLGLSGADVVLTLDLGLQKKLENRFRKYLAEQGVNRGMGVLLEPFTGKVLAVMNHPAYNPNYFWKADEQVHANKIYQHNLQKVLIEPVLSRAAAIEREGLEMKKLLPPTVAALDYGVDAETLSHFETRLAFSLPVAEKWAVDGGSRRRSGMDKTLDTLTGAQMSVALSSLVNGGWRVIPNVLDGIYDHGTERKYERREKAGDRLHLLDPATGIMVRKELFRHDQFRKKKKDEVVGAVAQYTGIELKDGLSNYVMQELYYGLIPAKMPKYLLLMAVERDALFPMPRQKKTEKLTTIGKDILRAAVKAEQENMLAAEKTHPRQKDQENLRQFFISKRLDFKKQVDPLATEVPLMPELRGLSLRKGMQKLNQKDVLVRVHGTGVITRQNPLPGEPLASVDECILTLQLEI